MSDDPVTLLTRMAKSASDSNLVALNAQLTEQTRLLQVTLGSISQGIFMVDANGRISTFNERVCDLLDLPASFLRSRPTLQEITTFQRNRGDFGTNDDLLNGEVRGLIDAAREADTVNSHLLAARTGPASYLRTTRHGGVLEVRTQILSSGGLVRTFTDVTNYVEAQEDREHLQKLLEATQSMAKIGGWEVDVANDTVFWTDEVYRMLDTTPQEFEPTIASTFKLFSPESGPRLNAAIRDAFGSGKSHDLDAEMITLKGRRIKVHFKGMVTHVGGRIVKLTSVLQDITERELAQSALRDGDAHLRQITSQVPGLVFQVRVTSQGVRQYGFVSDGVRELYGVEPEDVLADGELLVKFRHPQDTALVDSEVKKMLPTGLPNTTQFRLQLKDGSVKWVEMSSSGATPVQGAYELCGVMIDITERKRVEAEQRESEALWKLALDSTGDGVWDWHIQDNVEIYSNRYVEMYGYVQGELENTATASGSRIHPDDLDQVLRDRQAHFDGLTPTYINEHRVLCKDGSYKWILARGMVIGHDEQGKPWRMVGTHTDISRRKQSEALIWQQANFDTLTGLPNRRMLRDRLEQDIKKSRRDGSELAILFIDLDHFKEVNDTLGHDMGDQLLVEAAHRICACVRESDTVARMGGDEFTIILPEISDAGSLERIVKDILTSMDRAFELGTEQAYVSASIGITLYPTDGTEVEDLFKNADQALYVAKGDGRNRFSFFTPALQEAAQSRLRISHDLREGLAENQFRLVYQPIVELGNGAVHKAEALIRWHHPVRGLVSPAEFIPIAETSGIIVDIGNWVFLQAALQAKKWRESLNPQFQVSINKSPAQFHHSGSRHGPWVEQLGALGLPGSAIAVEITEGLLLDANPEVGRKLLQMRDQGIQVSLDDFGTGYSALSYLQKFDIDYIKIDQSFVRGLGKGSTDLALCKAIIVMAHELGLKVIAEGIETAQQRDLLVHAGCDFGQGYLFARPMSAADFEADYQRRT